MEKKRKCLVRQKSIRLFRLGAIGIAILFFETILFFDEFESFWLEIETEFHQ